MEWSHIEVLKVIGSGMALCTCMYCAREFRSGAKKIRAQIMSISGVGVLACPNAPSAKEICMNTEMSQETSAISAKRRHAGMQEADTAEWLQAIQEYYFSEKFSLVELVTIWKV